MTHPSDIAFTPAGLELLVLDGDFTGAGERFKAQSWLRLPKGSALEAKAGPSGCRVWMKLGHLARPQLAPELAPDQPPHVLRMERTDDGPQN